MFENVGVPRFESVHARLGFSKGIGKQREGQHRWGEERLVSRRAAIPLVRCEGMPVAWQCGSGAE